MKILVDLESADFRGHLQSSQNHKIRTGIAFHKVDGGCTQQFFVA